jgi:glycerophosphoryl diester phosphodiesterase
MMQPLIIAHRGFSAQAPENTLAAFELALVCGADGIEFDVRLAKDGVPVVIHDATLERTGLRSESIADLTSLELGDTDVGSWFNKRYPDKAAPEFAESSVPTLVEVLEVLKEFEGLVYVELKADERDFRELVRAVCAVIADSQLLQQMIVKSFKLAALPEVRRYLPKVTTAALFEPRIMDFLRRRKYILELAHEFDVDQLSLHRSLVTRGLARRAAEANMPVTIWTVDDPNWIKRCRKLGIGALITNDPQKLLAKRRAEFGR